MPYYLQLKQPLIVTYNSRKGKTSRTFDKGVLLPVIRIYEPHKPMHRKFPYECLVPGVGLRRFGRNADQYDLVEVTEDAEPEFYVIAEWQESQKTATPFATREEAEAYAAEKQAARVDLNWGYVVVDKNAYNFQEIDNE